MFCPDAYAHDSLRKGLTIEPGFLRKSSTVDDLDGVVSAFRMFLSCGLLSVENPVEAPPSKLRLIFFFTCTNTERL